MKIYIKINNKRLKVIKILPFLFDNTQCKMLHKLESKIDSNISYQIEIKINKKRLYIDKMIIIVYPKIDIEFDIKKNRIILIKNMGKIRKIDITSKLFKNKLLNNIKIIEVEHYKKLVEYLYFKNGKFLFSKKKRGLISKLAEFIEN